MLAPLIIKCLQKIKWSKLCFNNSIDSRSVTSHHHMVAKFLDYNNNRELKQRRWQQERQKSSRFITQNNYMYARASHFFVHFLAIVA